MLVLESGADKDVVELLLSKGADPEFNEREVVDLCVTCLL